MSESFDLTASVSETDASTVATEDLSKDIPPDEYAIQLLCKEKLRSKIFLGNYLERRLVSEVIGYRDVISVSKVEKHLKSVLQSVRKTLKDFYPANFWVGITNLNIPGTPLGDCLWVELSNVPFGVHWFLIKTVRFRKYEVLLKLQCIRSLLDENTELPSQITANEAPGNIHNTPEVSLNDSLEVISQFLQQAKRDALKSSTEFLTSLTLSNVLAVPKFLIVTGIAFVTGAVCLVGNMGDFTLRLFREASLFVHSATPIVLGFMDFCSKIVGGFYILIAMIFRDRDTSRFTPQITYPVNGNSRRSVTNVNPNVTITEID